MKQFIRYLYEYDNGKRIRNVGFTKVEKQADRCSIHIYGKGLDAGAARKLEVSVFYIQDGQCIGTSQGMIEGNSPVVSYILKFAVDDVGNQEAFDAVEGIVLENSNGRKYAAVWSDLPVDLEHMKTREEVEAEREVLEENVVPENVVQEVSAQEVSAQATRTRESLIEHVEKLVEEQEVAVAEVEPSVVDLEEVDTYIPPSARTYEKIQRQDISRLPRREWKLANNSFLLHGFYNYHHLLYITEGDHRWLGVPGIYHEKEMSAARAFGFPQFHRITDADVELSKEEKNTYDDFGYWCRQVDRQ